MWFCLQFIHGGHTDKVTEFAWSENDDWVIASCAEDNVLQLWQMAENIYNEPEGDDPVATIGPFGTGSGGDNTTTTTTTV